MIWLFLLLPLFTQAEPVRIVVWQPPGHAYSYLIPVIGDESFERAVRKYQSTLNQNTDLRQNLFPQPLELPPGKITELRDQAHTPQALVMANKAQDMQPGQSYVKNVAAPLRDRGIKPYVLPLGAELRLSEKEAADFRAQLVKKFDLLVAMGGDDVEPALYGQDNRLAKGPLSATRDQAELRLIREYNQSKRGFFVGICRGSQLLGVSAGCPLVQDIPKQLGVSMHGKGEHNILIRNEHSIHLAPIFKGAQEAKVNTLHHQSVRANGNDQLRVVAVDPYGITEATELKTGQGLGVQFHPELMDEKVKKPFFDHVVGQVQKHFRANVRGCQLSYQRLLQQGR